MDCYAVTVVRPAVVARYCDCVGESFHLMGKILASSSWRFSSYILFKKSTLSSLPLSAKKRKSWHFNSPFPDFIICSSSWLGRGGGGNYWLPVISIPVDCWESGPVSEYVIIVRGENRFVFQLDVGKQSYLSRVCLVWTHLFHLWTIYDLQIWRLGLG